MSAAKIETLADAKKRLARQKYNALVLKTFDDMTHQEKRGFLERRAAIEAASRERL